MGKIKNILILAILLLNSAVSWAQYSEETGTLESIYEMRARQALNTILRTQDYSLVISAEINRDQEKLKQYKEELELMNLPGMPMPGNQPESSGHNVLHELKSRIEVNLVLNHLVPIDKENILKALLVSKLHLDESAGDKINIQRSVFTENEDSPPLLPEYSWKTWAMILVLALFALAGVIFWANRRQRKEIKVNGDVKPEEKIEEPNLTEAPLSAAHTQEPTQAPEDLDLERKIAEEVLLQQMKEHLIVIGTQFPIVASKGIINYFNENDKKDIVAVFEHVGWDLSRTLFSHLPASVWGKLGSLIKDKKENLTHTEKFLSVSRVYRFVLSAYMQNGNLKDEDLNPFHFLSNLSTDELKSVLSGESPKNLALVSLYLEPTQFETFFNTLPPQSHSQIAVEITNIKQLPSKTIENLAQSLNEKLGLFRKNPIVSPDGPDIIARILRVLTPEEEKRIIENLIQTNASDSIKIRQQLLYLPDIVYLPPEIVAKVLNDFDSDELRAAFDRFDAQSRKDVFKYLPVKKVAIIEKDIQDRINVPSEKLVAQTWRTMSIKIEKELKANDIKLVDFLGRNDSLSARNKLAA